MDQERDLLLTPNTAQTLAFAGVGGIGVALMFGGGSLTYGGYFVALIFGVLIVLLHRKEAVTLVTTGRGWKHLIIPLVAIAVLVLGGGVLFYRKVSDHPLTLIEFWQLVLSTGLRVLTDAQAWFFVIVISLFSLWRARAPATDLEATSTPNERSSIPSLFRGEMPDFRVWDTYSKYKLYQAAYLWANQRPPNNEYAVNLGAPGEAYLMLENAIREGNLSTFNDRNVITIVRQSGDSGDVIPSGIGPKTVVSRDELIKFAEAKNLRPMFLFKDAREKAGYAWMAR